MTRKLTAHVHVDGSWYRPGDSPPADVAARITNPKVWDAPAEPDVSKRSDANNPPKERQVAKAEQVDPVKQPPRKGPGSGGPAWIEFAAHHGVNQTFDSKDALIGHLENEGIIEKE